MKSDGLHRLGDVPLAAWQRVLCEELLNLNSCVFCEESLTAGLDEVREKETRGVSPLEQLEVVLEELPGDVSSSAVLGDAPNQMDRVLAAHARPNAEVEGLRQQRLVRESSETRPSNPLLLFVRVCLLVESEHCIVVFSLSS